MRRDLAGKVGLHVFLERHILGVVQVGVGLGLAGRKAGGPSGPCGPGRKTPSVTAAWRWAWRLSPEPKRWRKETAPTRGRGDGGVAWFEQSSFSISARKILLTDGVRPDSRPGRHDTSALAATFPQKICPRVPASVPLLVSTVRSGQTTEIKRGVGSCRESDRPRRALHCVANCYGRTGICRLLTALCLPRLHTAPNGPPRIAGTHSSGVHPSGLGIAE